VRPAQRIKPFGWVVRLQNPGPVTLIVIGPRISEAALNVLHRVRGTSRRPHADASLGNIAKYGSASLRTRA
jgi:hypothetical protein